MKKIVLILCIAALFFPLSWAFAQIEESAMAKGSADLHFYRPTNLQFDHYLNGQSEFLKQINEDKDAYNNFPTSKMGRGALNTATSWVEIPDEISKTTQQSNLFAGVVAGFSKGLVSGIVRGASGIVDMATFGLPPYDQPLMQPKYKNSAPPEKDLNIDLMKW